MCENSGITLNPSSFWASKSGRSAMRVPVKGAPFDILFPYEIWPFLGQYLQMLLSSICVVESEVFVEGEGGGGVRLNDISELSLPLHMRIRLRLVLLQKALATEVPVGRHYAPLAWKVSYCERIRAMIKPYKASAKIRIELLPQITWAAGRSLALLRRPLCLLLGNSGRSTGRKPGACVR